MVTIILDTGFICFIDIARLLGPIALFIVSIQPPMVTFQYICYLLVLTLRRESWGQIDRRPYKLFDIEKWFKLIQTRFRDF